MAYEEAVLRLAEATARALEQDLLRHLGESEIERGATAPVPDGGAPDLVPLPGLATRIALAGGAGDLVLAIGEAGARRLAEASAGGGAAEADDGEGFDLAAAGEVAGKAVTAAASATAALLGLEAQAASPETRSVADREALEAVLGPDLSAVAVSAALVIAGEPAVLLLRVPAELVPSELQGASGTGSVGIDEGAVDRSDGVQADSLRGIPVRLWAELGRFRMEVGRAVALAPGSVVEIDTEVDDPIELFVNGRRLGTARLLVGAEGEWAIKLEELVQPELQRVSAELDLSR